MMTSLLRTAGKMLAFAIVAASAGVAQLKGVSVERLPLDPSHAWTLPQWSPDGASVYFTAADFNGIWAYSMHTGTTRQVTAEPRSGFGFTVAPDGSVSFNSAGVKPAESLSLIGVEESKIVLRVHGKKTVLDPLGKGRYIWPALSPDGSRLAAYDMERGSFVCDLSGNNPVIIGRRDAAVWTRDGRWLIYMADKDDGHRVLSSEIAFVSPDGKLAGRLTSTDTLTEMYPHCSPIDNRVVCSTMEGGIVVITYVEEGR